MIFIREPETRGVRSVIILFGGHSVRFTHSTSALLINSRNELIASSSRERTSDPDKIIEALEGMTNKNDDAFEAVTLNDEKTLIGTVPVDHTDWRFILVVPQHDIVKIAQKSRNQMLVIFLFVAAMTFPLAFWVSASSSMCPLTCGYRI